MSRRASTSAALVVIGAALGAACATSARTRPEPFPGVATAARRAPSSVETARPAPATQPSAPVSATASALIAAAIELVGTPYRLGGQSPDAGFDCSGLVSYAAALQGISLPRTAAQQYDAGTAIDRADVAAGDLVFFSTIGPGATHVGIVVSTGPDARFVHAPADGASVRIERFDTPYWQRRWVGARRIISDDWQLGTLDSALKFVLLLA